MKDRKIVIRVNSIAIRVEKGSKPLSGVVQRAPAVRSPTVAGQKDIASDTKVKLASGSRDLGEYVTDACMPGTHGPLGSCEVEHCQVDVDVVYY